MADQKVNGLVTVNRQQVMFFDELLNSPSKERYRGEAIRWLDCGDHYELIFTDDFVTPSSHANRMGSMGLKPFFSDALLTDIIIDMRHGDKDKELHVFVGSFGGEVAALSMILQQLICYKYRVGINLGTACSCGWMLLFACQERYVSPFSQTMYHDMSVIHVGKHSELRNNADFMNKWQQELLKVTDTAKVLTEKELELGKTTEVWLTGRDLIERNAARDYSEYLSRQIPGREVIHNGKSYRYNPIEDGWSEYVRVPDSKLFSYADMLKMLNKSTGDDVYSAKVS